MWLLQFRLTNFSAFRRDSFEDARRVWGPPVTTLSIFCNIWWVSFSFYLLVSFTTWTDVLKPQNKVGYFSTSSGYNFSRTSAEYVTSRPSDAKFPRIWNTLYIHIYISGTKLLIHSTLLAPSEGQDISKWLWALLYHTESLITSQPNVYSAVCMEICCLRLLLEMDLLHTSHLYGRAMVVFPTATPAVVTWRS
jgi:hypothetical protein